MSLWFELSYTFRLLKKKAGFTSLCAFVIAAGLAIAVPLIVLTKFTGAASLAIPDSERLAIIMEDSQVSSVVPTSQRLDPFVYQHLKGNLESFELLTTYHNATSTISDGATAEILSSAVISAEFMAVANTAPLMGRNLIAADNVIGAPPVAVISHSLWRNYYNSDPEIIGSSSRIDGQIRTIVGVMPEGFSYPYLNDLWLPIQLAANPEPGENKSILIVGLLKEGIDFAEAELEVQAALAPLSDQFPEFYGDKTGVVMHYTKVFNSQVVPVTGLLLLGLCIAVLLLVAFNVGNLLLIRSNERLAELGIRSAVGGTRLKITGQVLLESFLIAGTAVLVGLTLGQFSLSYLAVVYPDYFAGFPFWFTTNLDLNDISKVFMAAACIWILAGVYPAWNASRSGISEVLNGKSLHATGAGKFTRTLVALELIASCFLLIVSLAMSISIYNAYRNDLGIDVENILASRINLNADNYQRPEAKLNYLQQLGLEIENQEEFQETEFTTAPPRISGTSVNFQLFDQDLRVEGRFPSTNNVWVSEGYLQQIGLGLIEGRFFEFDDNQNNAAVVVIDDQFARQHWPDESAIGKQIIFDAGRSAETLTVIGVVRFLLQGNPIGSSLTQSSFYRPFAQLPLSSPTIQSAANRIFATTTTPLLVASGISISQYEELIKQTSARIDRDVPILDVLPLRQMSMLPGAPFNLFADLMMWVSVITALLAIAGIYGVVSRSVILRTRELSIRRAVGSNNQMILNLFLKQASSYLAASFIIGGAGAVLVLSILVDQIQSAGLLNVVMPVTIAVLSGLACLVFLASIIPARKIVAMEPGESLHYE